MSRLLIWIIGAIVVLWLIGILFKVAFKVLIIGTVVFVVLYFLGFVGNKRR